MTRFVGLELVPDPVLFPAFALPASLWIAAVGLLMWRRAASAQPPTSVSSRASGPA